MSPPVVKCPTCRRPLDWSSSEYRPFCSERCRLIDLGAWLAERHVIPGEAAATDADAENDAGGSNPDRV
jgi:endogenous inhibitor of DNA gyrase (YacG/DUF329 family)